MIMLNDIFLDTLRIIHDRLENISIIWAITGSVGLVLQGVETAVHDIDLQADQKGAYAIEHRFAKQMFRPVQFSSTVKIRSHFGAFALNGIKVEIIGDIEKRLPDGTWEAPPDLSALMCRIEIARMQLPVLSLAYEYAAYLKMGRTAKAALIKKRLEKD